METLKGIRKRKERRRKELTMALEKMTERLKGMGAVRIVLFGSLASGRITSRSDLDLLVIMPPTRDGREWAKMISRELEREIACDILVYTERELKERLPSSRFLRHIVERGKILYEKGP